MSLQVEPSFAIYTCTTAAIAASVSARIGPLATAARATSTATASAFDAATSAAARRSASDAVLVCHVWLVRQRRPRARANAG